MRAFLGFLAALLFAAPAWATCSSVPFTFSPGTTAQSGQVNANLAALVTCLNNINANQITGGTIASARLPPLFPVSVTIADGPIISGNLTPLVTTANSTTITAALIRANITGNVQRDVNQSVVYIAPGSTAAIADANAYSAYVRSDVAGGAADNGVGYKVMAVCNSTANCEVFGGNSIIGDALIGNVITATAGQNLVGWEYDFFTTSPNTNVSGINFQLEGSVSQPNAANAMACAPNLAATIHWSYCLVSNNGSTVAGGAAVYVGSQSTSGANKLSQLIQYGYFDAASVGRIYSTGVNAAQGFFIQTSAGAGLAKLDIDGNLEMPQAGQFVLGVDTIIGSVAPNSVTFGNGGTVTTVGVGNGTASVSITGSGVKMPSLTTVAAGTGKRFLCIDTATHQVYEGTGASCN